MCWKIPTFDLTCGFVATWHLYMKDIEEVLLWIPTIWNLVQLTTMKYFLKQQKLKSYVLTELILVALNSHSYKSKIEIYSTSHLY